MVEKSATEEKMSHPTGFAAAINGAKMQIGGAAALIMGSREMWKQLHAGNYEFVEQIARGEETPLLAPWAKAALREEANDPKRFERYALGLKENSLDSESRAGMARIAKWTSANFKHGLGFVDAVAALEKANCLCELMEIEKMQSENTLRREIVFNTLVDVVDRVVVSGVLTEVRGSSEVLDALVCIATHTSIKEKGKNVIDVITPAPASFCDEETPPEIYALEKIANGYVPVNKVGIRNYADKVVKKWYREREKKTSEEVQDDLPE